MDYNQELQKIIQMAKRDGYCFINEKFEKENNKFPVMEILLIDNSVNEDTGYWYIFKKTYKIEYGEFEEIKTFANKNDSKSFRCCCSESNDIEDIIENIVFKYDESDINFLNANTGGYINVSYTKYSKYSEDDECVDFWFTKSNEDDDFPRGFISFYEMEVNDFEKSDNVNIHLEKFMKYN